MPLLTVECLWLSHFIGLWSSYIGPSRPFSTVILFDYGCLLFDLSLSWHRVHRVALKKNPRFFSGRPPLDRQLERRETGGYLVIVTVFPLGSYRWEIRYDMI